MKTFFQLQNLIEGIIFPIRTDQTELESLETPSISFIDSITQFSTGLGMLLNLSRDLAHNN